MRPIALVVLLAVPAAARLQGAERRTEVEERQTAAFHETSERLYVELAEGCVLEYLVDDVRLVRARAGRLGPYELGERRVEMLGDAWLELDGGAPGATFRRERVAGGDVLHARLESTDVQYFEAPRKSWQSDPRGRYEPTLTYALVDPDGKVVAHVDESLHAESTGSARGFVRRFTFRRAGTPLRVSIDALHDGEVARNTGIRITSGPPTGADWSLDIVARDQWAAYREGDGVRCVVWSRPRWLTYDTHQGRLVVTLDRVPELEPEPFRLEVATFVTAEGSDEVVRQIDDALRR